MAFVAQQQWIKAIEENLFRGGLEAIALAGTDDSAYIQGEKVNIRNAGTPVAVTKGNRTYPVSISQRSDDTLTYDLTNYEMGPLRIDSVDQIQTSPSLLNSNVNDLLGSTSDRAARETMIAWYHYTTGKYVETSGDNFVAHAPSATGNRKGITGKDVLKAAAIMNAQKVKQNDRYLLVDSVMFAQLIADLSYNADRLEVVGGLQMILPPVFGFKVIEMPEVVFAATAGTVRDYAGTSATTTDKAVALAVQKNCVSHAWSDTRVKIDTAASGYFAEALIEAWKYGGGSYRRTDKKGVVPIIQTIP